MFRFTIRDMLWLTVVVALAVGWWIDRRVQRSLVDAVSDQWSLELNRNREVKFEAAAPP
jgi:hypothetical protein